jgi:putative polyhydroxyalkanoate system protein
MASISIAKKHNLTHKKAKAVAEKIAQDLKQRFALDYAWDGDSVDFERPGVSGRMHVSKDKIVLDVSLGFLLTPLRSTIEKEITAQLDRLLREKPTKA